jgi:hypothetical protein
LEDYGYLALKGTFSKVFMFRSFNGNFLFAFSRELKSASIFIIKSCISFNNTKDIDLKPYSSPKISNFRIAKKSQMELEYEPNYIDAYADYFLLSYVVPCHYVDLYEKTGVFH